MKYLEFACECLSQVVDFVMDFWHLIFWTLVAIAIVYGCSQVIQMRCHYTGNPKPETIDLCSTAHYPNTCMTMHGHERTCEKPE
jgi:hypothetical protein